MEKLTINKEFAAKYNISKDKQEYQRLKDKYGDVSSSSSTEESEDSDAEADPPELEVDFLRTLTAIRNRDPKIYDPTTTFYHQVDDDDGKSATETSNSGERDKKKKKKDVEVFPQDLKRNWILDKMKKDDGDTDDDDNDKTGEESDADDKRNDSAPVPGSYHAKEAEISQSIRLHARTVEDEDSDEEDDFLLPVKQRPSKEEVLRTEAEYTKFLRGEQASLANKQLQQELKPLRDTFTDPNIDPKEKELLNFVIDRKYKKDDYDSHMTAEEMLAQRQFLEEEEEQLEKEELFEIQHAEAQNSFRFEEPGATTIPSYPRSIPSSLRTVDSRRSDKRKQDKEREIKKKEKRKEELKRLKNLKKKEVLDKIARLARITGNKKIGLCQADLEMELGEDFDPKKQDKLMKKLLGSDYYDQDDDDVKPVFEDEEDDEFGDQYVDFDEWGGPPGEEDYDGKEGNEDLHCDHPDFVMDADHVPREKKDKGKKSAKKEAKKMKKNSKFVEALEAKKPVFDPDEMTFDDYIKEYYDIDTRYDYEDMIGDLPVRFHYRQVVPNDYGLTTDEILKASNKDLTAWVSVKKLSQYRTKEEEELEVRLYRRKAKNKFSVLTSLAVKEEEDGGAEGSENKKKKRKRKKKQSESSASATVTSDANANCTSACQDNGDVTADTSDIVEEPAKKRKVVREVTATESITETLPEKSCTEKKKKNKQSLDSSSKEEVVDGQSTTESAAVIASDRKLLDKKKNKKKKVNRPSISDDRLKAYGINPKVFKYKYLKDIKKT